MGTSEEKSESAGAKSFFDVLFIGLFCFRKQERVAVMPDGRTPDDPDIQAYEPFLVVDPKDVNAAQSSGWEGNDPALTEEGIYTFSNCTISITTATTEGNLVADQHDDNVLRAVNIDPDFEYSDDWGTGIIAAVKLGQGTLEFLRRPDRPNIEQGIGTLSRLRVPHEGDVVVTVAVQGEPQPRVLALNPGADVAVVNGFLGASSKPGDARRLYGKITKGGTFTPVGSPAIPKLPVAGASYQVFKIKLPFVVAGIGCCPPP